MSNAPFPITPELVAITIAYRNAKLIADNVLPRVPVGKQEFKYWRYSLGEGFTIPDTKVGRKSRPNEVEFSATETPDSTEDFGLDDPIPQADIDNAPPKHDPVGKAVEQLTNLVLLDKEVRTASRVFNVNNYGLNNRATLSGTSQFNDFSNSDPIRTIMDALDACIMRPNVMVIGRAVFSTLARHPRIVKAVLGNAGDSGIARRQDIAELFELEEVLVGEAWLNTAKKGQPVSLARAWGRHISLVYRDLTADTRGGTTYGYTAQWGSRIAGANPDSNIGLRGGQRVRVGESVKEVICANDLGYFIQNAIA